MLTNVTTKPLHMRDGGSLVWGWCGGGVEWGAER